MGVQANARKSPHVARKKLCAWCFGWDINVEKIWFWQQVVSGINNHSHAHDVAAYQTKNNSAQFDSTNEENESRSSAGFLFLEKNLKKIKLREWFFLFLWGSRDV